MGEMSERLLALSRFEIELKMLHIAPRCLSVGPNWKTFSGSALPLLHHITSQRLTSNTEPPLRKTFLDEAWIIEVTCQRDLVAMSWRQGAFPQHKHILCSLISQEVCQDSHAVAPSYRHTWNGCGSTALLTTFQKYYLMSFYARK